MITANKPSPSDGLIQASFSASVIIAAASAEGDKKTGPRITMQAYNGGPMRLSGYRYPVVVDGTGVKAAAGNLPLYVGHAQPWDGIQAQMDQLLGQTDEFTVDQANGTISAAGPITGESDLVEAALTHAKNGFKFQASINGQPTKMDFLAEGNTATVNGRLVAGPVFIARAVTCDHIALVPLGADSSTTTSIAAQAAKGFTMEFAAWLTATYGLDATKLTAAQKEHWEAEFKRISAASAGTQTVTPTTTNPAAALITAAGAAADTQAIITAQRAALAAESKRSADVQKAAKDHPEIAAKAVAEGWDLDKTELEVMRAERTATKSADAPNAIIASAKMPTDGLQLATVHPKRGGRHLITAGGRIGNDLAAVIEVIGLISAGYSAEKLSKSPSYGVRAVEVAERTMSRFGSSLGPMGLIRLAASFAGVSLSSNAEEAYSQLSAEFSTLSLPVILSNLMNKFLWESYTAVDPDYADPARGTAWQKFTKAVPVNDFKPNYMLRLTGDMTFKDLGPTGEIQSGKLGEQSYKIQANTKAIMFGLTRKQIIDDDLSAFSTLPTQFGRGAGITIAQAIYDAIIANKESDGSTTFFRAADVTTKGALMVQTLLTGSALAFDTLQAAVNQMAIQTDPHGQPAGLVPEVLLLPAALAGVGLQLFSSENIPTLVTAISKSTNTGGSVPQANTLRGLYRPVASAYLSQRAGGSASTWYLTTGPGSQAPLVTAGFLNGQQMPIVERAEADFDRLGIAFRGFIDFGVALGEPRGAIKNTA